MFSFTLHTIEPIISIVTKHDFIEANLILSRRNLNGRLNAAGREIRREHCV